MARASTARRVGTSGQRPMITVSVGAIFFSEHDARGGLGVRDRSLRCGPPGAGAAGGAGAAAEHPGDLRRRHRACEHQRLLARPDGLPDAEHRPDRPRGHDVHRLLRRAELHRGTLDLHHRPGDAAHRALQGRDTGRPGRAAGPRSDDRGAPEAARLRHRAVRQEPSRRSQRVPADRPRLRRVLRQPLPPQRRGGAGELRLPERPALSGAVRPARRAALQGDRPDDRPSSRAGAGSAGRRSRTPARSPASGWRRSTTRPRTRRSTSSSGRSRPARRSSAGSTRPACTRAPTCGRSIATSRG